MQRNHVLDAYRALAIILVTGFHIAGWSLVGSGVVFHDLSTKFSIGPFDISGVFGNGWIGVGIFFVISGYCMSQSVSRKFHYKMEKHLYLKYLANRLLRICLPYYASIAVWVFLIDFFWCGTKACRDNRHINPSFFHP